MNYHTIAIQGERGAFSEQAAIRILGRNINIKPTRTVADAITAVTTKTASAAVLPSENSYAGIIADTYDALATSRQLTITAETYLSVRHCLLALPGQKLTDITRVKSHPQPLPQCDQYLQRLGVNQIPDYDTAGSAMELAQSKQRRTAVIASEKAAHIYNLDVLARNIQTSTDNCTRFWLVAPHADTSYSYPAKTIILISIPDQTGALHKCLTPIAGYGINMSGIQVRPARERNWEYQFYLELAGSPGDPAIKAALRTIGATAKTRILGAFTVDTESLTA